ncbi:hypothetical protein BD779DRAFT_1517207 [Infundibulicybe gibba]|nr:hypothetical protein BD779DRAFT_1517207 [Infundibulicybe gibba]
MSEFSTVIGPLLLGVFLNTYIYGISAFQYASYQLIKFGDPYWIKYPVLFSSSSIHFILHRQVVYMAWGYCVSNYINPSALWTALWPYTLTPMCTALSGIIAHVFLAHRSFHLLKQKFLYGTTWFSRSLLALGMAAPAHRSLLTASLVVQVVTNFLVFAPHAGGIQTGFFTGAFALAGLVAFRVSPQTTVYALFAIPVGRIYTNAILDTLLAREPPAPPTATQHNQMKTQRPVSAAKSRADAIWAPRPCSKPPTQASFSLHSIHVCTEVFTDAVNSKADEGLRGDVEGTAGSSYAGNTKAPFAV